MTAQKENCRGGSFFFFFFWCLQRGTLQCFPIRFMDQKLILLLSKDTVRDVSLRSVVAILRYILPPASVIFVGYQIYKNGPKLDITDDLLVYESLEPLTRQIFRRVFVDRGEWLLGAFFYFGAVMVGFHGGHRLANSVESYRIRTLRVAQIESTLPKTPSIIQRLQRPSFSPYTLNNDIWDEIISYLSQRLVTKFV